MTIREYLEQVRESMLYLREKNEDLRMAELMASNPIKRDLDSMVLSLDEKRGELERLTQETTERGKHAYALIGFLPDRKQREAMWAYYVYGLTEGAAMKRGRYSSHIEMQRAMAQGLKELNRIAFEMHKEKRKQREGRQCLN